MEPTHDHTRRIGSAAIGASVKTIATAATIAPGVLSCTAISEARDNGRNKLVSDDMEAWIEGLTDRAGANCRSDADGVMPQEVDWDMGGNYCSVKLEGQWIDVPSVPLASGRVSV